MNQLSESATVLLPLLCALLLSAISLAICFSITHDGFRSLQSAVHSAHARNKAKLAVIESESGLPQRKIREANVIQRTARQLLLPSGKLPDQGAIVAAYLLERTPPCLFTPNIAPNSLLALEPSSLISSFVCRKLPHGERLYSVRGNLELLDTNESLSRDLFVLGYLAATHIVIDRDLILFAFGDIRLGKLNSAVPREVTLSSISGSIIIHEVAPTITLRLRSRLGHTLPAGVSVIHDNSEIKGRLLLGFQPDA